MKKKLDLSALARSKVTWAVVAEALILLVCLFVRPDFFSISYQPTTGMLFGNIIDIINRSSEITIIAMGMTLVIALGAGLAIWGVINLLEGYGNDNPGAKSQGMKQLMAGGGVALVGVLLVPLLSGLFG